MARIVTKRDLTADDIQAMVRHGLGPDATVAGHRELTDGSYAAVYAVDLADGRELVLKVAPDPGLRLMRYEVDLMRTEIEFYRRAGAAGVPLPTLHAADADLGYLLVDRLRGTSLATLAPSMAPGQLERIRRDLGAVCARLHSVTGDLFGYPRADGHTRAARWSDSFLAIIDDVLADAVEYDRELPVPAPTIRAIVARHADLLDDVTTPTLVHFDLWDGNVFLVPDGEVPDGDAPDGDVPDGDGYAIEGIIDGERAFYGDPIAELVSLALFTEPEAVPGLLPGYLGRGLTARERVRLRLYTAYLYLIMVTEGPTRGFDPEAHEPVRRAAFDRLAEQLAALDT